MRIQWSDIAWFHIVFPSLSQFLRLLYLCLPYVKTYALPSDCKIYLSVHPVNDTRKSFMLYKSEKGLSIDRLTTVNLE